MKTIAVKYSEEFIPSPMTGWVGPRCGVWIRRRTMSGQTMKAKWTRTTAYTRHKRYAQLEAHLDGINLCFATPIELDHFIDVMSQRLLPAGSTLLKGRTIPGLPNSHWLSRFPARGKALKFRMKATKLLTGSYPALLEFRDFYASKSLAEFETLFDGASFEGTGKYSDPYRIAS